jgi:ribosomal protein S18 acetylase RimI-like enzyme
LIEETSQADYKASSTGWRPKAKRKEMREEDMQYLLIRPWQHDEDTQSRDGNTKAKANLDGGDQSNTERIVAFASFMLTMEEDQAVIYIYEIHLDPSVRAIGVGKWLMRIVEEIGQKVGVNRSMLTVFTRNSTAENFYKRLGYSKDVISPTERKLRGGKVKRPDYLILSKNIT